ncbi:hypothetical protein [Paenibacillus sp. FSL M7-0896]|uniref:hypothetical protein n=1 Tax=Paenibacillus sp. FSL M7-0896 TaxID=2921610 RepID=UPI0030DA74CD
MKDLKGEVTGANVGEKPNTMHRREGTRPNVGEKPNTMHRREGTQPNVGEGRA